MIKAVIFTVHLHIKLQPNAGGTSITPNHHNANSSQTQKASRQHMGDCSGLNKLNSVCYILPRLHLRPPAHLPRVCPFQQRSSLVTSEAIFSSLQMVCGRDTQKPRMGRSRSFSSVTCAEAQRRGMSQTCFQSIPVCVAGCRKHIEAAGLRVQVAPSFFFWVSS